MNNGSCILDKIKSEADRAAEANIADAEAKAKAIKEKTSLENDRLMSELQNSASDIENEIISRRKTVAQIDAKKIVLNKKAEIFDKAYEKAITEIVKDSRYNNFLIDLLDRYAEDGDVIVINSADVSIITESVISRIAKSKKIKLVISPDYGDFRGGMMLLGVNADKNLTIESIVRSKKDELTSDIAKAAFKRQA